MVVGVPMPCARCGGWIQRPRWRCAREVAVGELLAWRFGPDGEVLYAVCEPEALMEEWQQAHASLNSSRPITQDALGRNLGQLAEIASRVRRSWDCERSAPDPVLREGEIALLALPPQPRSEDQADWTAAAHRQQHLEDLADRDLVAEIARRLATRLVPRPSSPLPAPTPQPSRLRSRGRSTTPSTSAGHPW